MTIIRFRCITSQSTKPRGGLCINPLYPSLCISMWEIQFLLSYRNSRKKDEKVQCCTRIKNLNNHIRDIL